MVTVAAAIVVLVGLQYRHSQALVFKQLEVVRAQYRGADGSPVEPVFSEAQLAVLGESLQQNLLRSYTELAGGKRGLFGRRADYAVGCSLQEMFEGALLVEVKVFTFKSGELVKSWNREIPGPDNADGEILKFSSEVATELALLNPSAK